MGTSESDETSSSENDEIVIQRQYPLGYAYKNLPSGNESRILEPQENVAGSVRRDISEKSSGSLETLSDNSCFNNLYGEMPWERRRRIFPQPGRLPFQKAVNEYEALNESRDNTSTQEEPIATNQLEISQTQEEGKGTADATETAEKSSINISPKLSDKESLKTDASGVGIPVNKTQTEVPETEKKEKKKLPRKSRIAARFSNIDPLNYSDDAGLLKDKNKTKEEIGKKELTENIKEFESVKFVCPLAPLTSRKNPNAKLPDTVLLKDQNKTKEEIRGKKFKEKVNNTYLKFQKDMRFDPAVESPADPAVEPPAELAVEAPAVEPPVDPAVEPPADPAIKPPADPAEEPNLVPEKLEKSESQNKIGVEEGKGPIENVAKRPVTALTGTIDVLQPNELDNPSDKDQIRSYVDKSMLHIECNNIFISIFVHKGTQIICKLKQRPAAHVDASDIESCSQTSAGQDAIAPVESKFKQSQETDTRKEL